RRPRNRSSSRKKRTSKKKRRLLVGMPDPRGPFLDGKAGSKTLPLAESAALDKGSVPVNQPLLFQRLRWRLLHHSLEVTLQRSVVRLVTILACSLLVWVGVFALSATGFGLLRWQHLPLFGGIVSFLLDFLFLALLVLLIFSTGLILYSSLFTTPEARFLLITPAAADQVFAFKFQGAVAF